jgi:hypothetical protein
VKPFLLVSYIDFRKQLQMNPFIVRHIRKVAMVPSMEFSDKQLLWIQQRNAINDYTKAIGTNRPIIHPWHCFENFDYRSPTIWQIQRDDLSIDRWAFSSCVLSALRFPPTAKQVP